MAIIEIGPKKNQDDCLHSGNKVFATILACLDSSPQSISVLSHAAGIAAITGAKLVVMRVLERDPGNANPTDPVDWAQRRQTAEADLKLHVSGFSEVVNQVVIEDGVPAERICDWVHDNGVDLTVLGTGGQVDGKLGSIARKVAERAEGSVLLAPDDHGHVQTVTYRRVMTPLDGSARAESALPVAVALATAHEADILLVHAAPNVDLTETGPLEPETKKLRDRLRRRNERVGAQYLKKVQSWFPASQARHSSRVLASGDPRHAIGQVANESKPDLIVLSATGYSGHPGVTLGSVAEFLIAHLRIPVLLVRGRDLGLPAPHYGLQDNLAPRMPLGVSL